MPDVTLLHGCSLELLRMWPSNSVDSVVTDPPYALVSIVKRFGGENAAPAKGDVYARASAGFMGQQWDTGEVAFAVEFWAEVMRVLKPGGHVLAFSGSRTYHRLAVAIEDAGFEIRDQIMWLYGSGFPKSHDVSKGIDAKLLTGRARTEDMRKLMMGGEYEPSGRGRVNYDHGGGSAMNGAVGSYAPVTDAARHWQGWGTALKPAHEPIVMARKPLIGTVAANVLAHGTGAINIDGCRVPIEADDKGGWRPNCYEKDYQYDNEGQFLAEVANGSIAKKHDGGRWPANVIHDGSDEVLEGFPDAGGAKAPVRGDEPSASTANTYGEFQRAASDRVDGGGSAARFFYCAKPGKAERGEGNNHPTVKPLKLMAYLCRLVTPPGGLILDPFAGSGTTGIAARDAGFRALLMEREEAYVKIIRQRLTDSST